MQELPTNIKSMGAYWKKQNDQSSAKHCLLPARTNCQFVIINSLLNITLTQKYLNPTNQIIQVQYCAPISHEYAIYDFFVEIDNHKIYGVIESRERANGQFRKANAEGKYASTAATMSEGFSFGIRNIMPSSQFTVVVCFMRQVSIRMNTFYYICTPSFRPRSSTKMQKPINSIEIEQKSNNQTNWDLIINLQTTKKLSFFNSPSHKLNIISKNSQDTSIMLIASAKEEEESPIFEFYYTTHDFHLPSCVAGGTDTSSTLMLSFIPKFCSLNLSDAYKASIENQPYLSDLQGVKGDFVFLIDQSGSMTGTKIEKAKQSLKLFIKSLPQQSYFNVISFGSESQRMFVTSKRNENQIIQNALNKIDLMSADMGGTQIYEPLKKCLEQKILQNYPRHIFILTDGDVINVNIILQMVRKNNRKCRIHSIGIGKAASVQLVQGCAQYGKGSFVMINENEDPIPKVINLLELALSPIIDKFNLLYEKMDEVESIVPNPCSMPYIFKDQIVNFYVTLKCPLTGTKTFDFQYEDAITKYVYKSTLKVDENNINYSFVNKMGHLKVIKCLEKSCKFNLNIENQMLFAKIDDYKNAAIEYSVKNKLLSQYTSFICIGGPISNIQQQKHCLKLNMREPSILQSTVEKTRIQISQKKAYIQKELSKAYPIVQQAYEQVRTIQSNQLIQICCYNRLPAKVQIVIKSLYCLISNDIRELDWANVRGILRQDIKKRIQNFKPGSIPTRILNHLMERYIDKLQSDFEPIKRASNVAGIFANWVISIVAYADLLMRLDPLIREVEQLQKNPVLKLQENSQNFATFQQHVSNNQTVLNSIQRNTVNMIIKCQEWNGSWSNTQLLEIVTSNSEQSLKKIKQFNPNISIDLKLAVLVTVAVVIWMQKYIHSQQYSLLIRKALCWLKNVAKQNGIIEMQYRNLVVVQ